MHTGQLHRPKETYVSRFLFLQNNGFFFSAALVKDFCISTLSSGLTYLIHCFPVFILISRFDVVEAECSIPILQNHNSYDHRITNKSTVG